MTNIGAYRVPENVFHSLTAINTIDVGTESRRFRTSRGGE